MVYEYTVENSPLYMDVCKVHRVLLCCENSARTRFTGGNEIYNIKGLMVLRADSRRDLCSMAVEIEAKHWRLKNVYVLYICRYNSSSGDID